MSPVHRRARDIKNHEKLVGLIDCLISRFTSLIPKGYVGYMIITRSSEVNKRPFEELLDFCT